MAQNGWIKKGYWGFVQGENSLRHPLILIIRLYWGWHFIITGLGKWTNIPHIAKYFASLDIPYPLLAAYLVGTVEVLGGLSLIIGLCTRFFSLLLTIVLVTAYATAHKAVFATFFTKPSNFISEEPFLYLYAVLVVLCFGPGLFSFDYWLEKKSYGEPL